MSEYSFLINNMTWSYTRLSSYAQCPHEWFLQYVEELKGDNNFYAEFGKFCHIILEKYAKGELALFELVDYYDSHFDEFIGEGYGDQRDKYKTLGRLYFENIDLDLDKYEILGIEKKCDFQLNGNTFTGYIDLLLKDKQTGEILLIDHKSSEYPMGKKGKIKKAEEQKFIGYKRQLYLYSLQVFNEYGVFPTKIGWNYFKSGQWLIIDFDKKEYEEALEWAKQTILEINEDEEFRPNQDWFYCTHLCRFRNQYCEYRR